jgi:hypothetical protein
VEESNDPFDGVVDITDRPCLTTVTGHGERLAR